MAIGKVNVGGAGGGKLNVFCQPTEPKVKEGIWIKSPTKEIVNGIVVDNNPYTANQWIIGKAYTNIPYATYGFGCISYNGKIYCIGGAINTSEYRYVQIYDIDSNTWSQGSIMPKGVYNFGCILYNNKIYCFGGLYSSSFKINYVQIYDIASNTWSQGTAMPNLRTDFGCILYKNEIYCFCGEGMNKVDIYNPQTDTWRSGTIRSSGMYGCACVLVENTVYFIGGSGPDKKDIETYDLINQTWGYIKSAMPIVLKNFGYVIFNNEVYCISGTTGSYNTQNIIQIYNITNNSWRTISANITTPRFLFGCVFKDDVIYCVGGNNSGNNVLNTIEAFSLKSKTYTGGNIILNRQSEISGNYSTQLFNMKVPINGVNFRLVSFFNNAWLYKNNDLKEYPTYYGNGTSWIKFKN